MHLGHLFFDQSKTRPAVAAVLLSTVVVFFKLLPLWISLRKPEGRPLPEAVDPDAGVVSAGAAGGAGGAGAGGGPVPGMGGGGGAPEGAPEAGIGGGGGGAGGAAGALLGGIGGGGGGAEAGASMLGPGGGGGGGGAIGASLWVCAGLPGADSFPAADNGRGGAMVPNRIEASCAALPPPGRSSSESSPLSSSLSEPQSSESALLREIGADGAGAGPPILWKGLVDAAVGGATGGAAMGVVELGAGTGEGVSDGCDIILK